MKRYNISILSIFLIVLTLSIILIIISDNSERTNQIAIIYYENGEIEQFNGLKYINPVNNESGLYSIKYEGNRYGYPLFIHNVTNIIIYNVK